LAAVVPCALLVLAGVWLTLRVRQRSFSSREWRLLVALAAIGPVCHLLLDFSNNYGVHPFWPLDNAWYYGDAVFIIEPWFWVSTLPALVYLARSRVAKAVLGLLLGVMIVLVWVVPLVPTLASVAVTLSVAVALLVLKPLRPSTRVIVGFAVSLAVLGVFVVSSRDARASAQRVTLAQYPEARILDAIVSPVPGTPVCFNALVLTLEEERYVIRSADVAPLPAWFPAGRCPPATRGQTAGLRPVEGAHSRPSSASVLWRGELALPANELVQLARESCHAHALLRFARAPFWRTVGSSRVLGDVRYDRDEALDFAEIELNGSGECPRAIPPWLPPRSDVPGIRSQY
jgi:inner membrane protein